MGTQKLGPLTWDKARIKLGFILDEPTRMGLKLICSFDLDNAQKQPFWLLKGILLQAEDLGHQYHSHENHTHCLFNVAN